MKVVAKVAATATGDSDPTSGLWDSNPSETRNAVTVVCNDATRWRLKLGVAAEYQTRVSNSANATVAALRNLAEPFEPLGVAYTCRDHRACQNRNDPNYDSLPQQRQWRQPTQWGRQLGVQRRQQRQFQRHRARLQSLQQQSSHGCHLLLPVNLLPANLLPVVLSEPSPLDALSRAAVEAPM